MVRVTYAEEIVSLNFIHVGTSLSHLNLPGDSSSRTATGDLTSPHQRDVALSWHEEQAPRDLGD